MSDEYLTAAIYGMKRFNEGIKRIINMEKLDELLKEYQLSKGEWVRLAGPDVEVNDKEELVLEATLISKKYGFIQWLVENEKIDFKKFDGDNYDYLEYPIGSDNYDVVYDYKDIIQWLSISDTPIEDLIYYLK